MSRSHFDRSSRNGQTLAGNADNPDTIVTAMRSRFEGLTESGRRTRGELPMRFSRSIGVYLSRIDDYKCLHHHGRCQSVLTAW
jgi:hypothetical protein